jgi:alpha-L-glutamate ligase-like protein
MFYALCSMFRFIKNSRKILGMNSRNLRYIRPNNRKRAVRLADDKILSKKVLKKGGIPVPDLLAKISSYEELDNFDWSKLPSGFALKPNRGLGGEGIVVVYGRKKGRDDAWVKADGSIITIDDIKNHIRSILDGNFSISGEGDIAFFEERLRLLKLFKTYAYKGIPDIRVIVFNKVPVMAMLRLPTKESGGKANLQQGGIGLGIDLATGVTTSAVQGKSKIVEYVPGTRLLLSGIRIPYWNDILEMAVKAQEISGLGFLGADVAIDKEKGPVFVEINARAGLSIQIANLAGLRGRLERVEGLKIKTIKRGVQVGKNLFGGEIEEELEEISGRRVIGVVEKVKLIGKNGKEIEVEAKIDTGAYSTSIDVELARELGFNDVVDFFEKIELPQNFTREESVKIEKELREKYLSQKPDLDNINIVYSSHGVSIRPNVKLSFFMNGIWIYSSANIIKRDDLKFRMIVGKRDLKKFLIDVNK